MMRLRPEHFAEPLHGRIYEAILRLNDRKMAANPVTLKPLFEADPAMIEMGGPAYLAGLTQQSGALIAARDFAEQIYDLALLRELIRVGREMATNARRHLGRCGAADPDRQCRNGALQGRRAGRSRRRGEDLWRGDPRSHRNGRPRA